MNIFDQFVDKVKEVSSTAATKAGDMMTREKLKVRITQANRYLEQEQAKLGALVYSFHLSGEEDEALKAGYIKNISSAIDQVDELKRELEKMEQLVYCGTCGAQNKGVSEFCYKCGGELKEEA